MKNAYTVGQVINHDGHNPLQVTSTTTYGQRGVINGTAFKTMASAKKLQAKLEEEITSDGENSFAFAEILECTEKTYKVQTFTLTKAALIKHEKQISRPVSFRRMAVEMKKELDEWLPDLHVCSTPSGSFVVSQITYSPKE